MRRRHDNAGGMQRRMALATLGSGVFLIAAIAAMFVSCDYRLNVTPSYPLGLWQVLALDRPAAVGDRVFICPSAIAADLGRERGYLPHGSCPSGTAPLIKTIVAVAGQAVGIDGSIVIDRLKLPFSSVRRQDAAGRPMTPWSGVVPEGQVFVYSDYGASYDSRYFGPLPAAGILGLARPVLVFAP
jgi:conjugative transfer signal peptidase TraF